MEKSSTLKLIMEKGLTEGEPMEFQPGSVVKIGRVVRGNTIRIKDAGISSKHLSIQFENGSSKWTVSDLQSSNGTFLNGILLNPNVPAGLKDRDLINIGEVTSIMVRIVAEAANRLHRNPRQQAKIGEAAIVVDKERSGLGLALVGALGESEVKEPVKKHNLRSRAKKTVDLMNVVKRVHPRRTSKRSKNEEHVNINSTLEQIPEDLNVDGRNNADLGYSIECEKAPGGRKKKLPVEPLENVETCGVEDNSSNINEVVRIDVAEELKLRQEGCEGKETVINENSRKGSSEEAVQPNMDKGKKVAEELKFRQIGYEGSVKDNQALDFETMTLNDFFDYLEEQLPKEIYDKTEKIISHLMEQARKCHEFRLQRNA